MPATPLELIETAENRTECSRGGLKFQDLTLQVRDGDRGQTLWLWSLTLWIEPETLGAA